VATQALRSLLEVAAGQEGVRRVVGRTEESNVASQRVMQAVGMQLVGRDPDFLHFEIDLQAGGAPTGGGADPGERRR
jgi:RimJ/RimL family protein N-acetyltransferase